MNWREWIRKDGLGHQTVLVFSFNNGDNEGEPRPGVRDGEVQCSTTDRIPFSMKKSALKQRYSPTDRWVP